MENIGPSKVFFVGLGVQFVGGLIIGGGLAEGAEGAVFLGLVVAAAGFWASVIGAGAWAVKIGTKPDEEAAIRDSEQRRCPYCAELIRSQAVVCRFCGRDLPSVTVEAQTLRDDVLTYVL